jgi:hypothetical protein
MHPFARFLVLAAAGCLTLPASDPAAAETVLVQAGSRITWRANASDPGPGTAWTQPAFDDSGWSAGIYGIGYETGIGAAGLIATSVPAGSASVYTRAVFSLPDPALAQNLFFGADFDDGCVIWINGVEVWRSPEMPPGDPAWNTTASLHESSNGATPRYDPLVELPPSARHALRAGTNVLAVGVWNALLPSSDLVVVPRLSMNREVAVTRGPYLQSGSHDRVTLRWRTASPVVGVVAWGTSADHLDESLRGPGPATEHELTLTGLLPDTAYHYTIAPSPQVHRFRTSPAPGQGGPTRVWVLGDSGTADANARAVRDAFLQHSGERFPDLWLMLGDNAYPDGTQGQYQSAVFDMYPEMLAGSVLWPTLGNHDGHTADSATQSGPYYDIFSLPRQGEAGGVPSGTEAYYSFDHGRIHFICLESYETDRSPSGAMMTWLREDALSTTADWLIAFWHHPPYSKGSHDSDRETELIQMREHALPILEEAGVDLVLAGHSHSYERSFLLDGHYGGSATLVPSMIRDSGDGRETGDGAYLKPEGLASREGAVYVVAGSSGTISGGRLDHPTMFVSLNALGSLVLDVNGGRLDGFFLDAAGAVRDRFTILKETPNTPPVPVARAVSPVECASADGTPVLLDASASHDADYGDAVVRHEWIEDFGTAEERQVGVGETLEAPLALGAHALTLRVTDGRGATATAALTVVVQDTIPPSLDLAAEPRTLWPPDNRFQTVQVDFRAADACGEPAVTLFTVDSSDAPADAGDIRGAEPGTPDREVDLRARRAGNAPTHVYTLVYRAADPSGNTSSASVEVVVPHDLRPAPPR